MSSEMALPWATVSTATHTRWRPFEGFVRPWVLSNDGCSGARERVAASCGWPRATRGCPLGDLLRPSKVFFQDSQSGRLRLYRSLWQWVEATLTEVDQGREFSCPSAHNTTGAVVVAVLVSLARRYCPAGPRGCVDGRCAVIRRHTTHNTTSTQHTHTHTHTTHTPHTHTYTHTHIYTHTHNNNNNNNTKQHTMRHHTKPQ
jgi:hypothetical protein